MAGGGKFKIKGGVASKREAVVEDGALLVTGISGGGGAARFQLPFYGEDAANGVTDVELMEENTEIGIPFARAVSAGRVAVKFRRRAGVVGNWTLRLFKNGVAAATFTVVVT